MIVAPGLAFDLAALDPPRYPEIWQGLGMVVGVYGIGYLVAARNPVRHWPIVLVGMLGKLFGPLGFVVAARSGTLPWSFGWTIVTNDLVWWWPFLSILATAWRFHHDRAGRS